jgi:anti-sigma B factor antagonist
MDVEVQHQPDPDGWLVKPSGQLDMQTAPRLAATLERLIDEGVNRIVVDLSRLTFCDSMGLSALIVAHRSCVERGGYLRLAKPSPFLLNLLTVVGVRDVIGVYESLDAACTAEP